MRTYQILGSLFLALASLTSLPSCGGTVSDAELDSAPEATDQLIATASPCVVTSTRARCNSQPVQRIGVSDDVRRVYWARPSEPAPAQGYPAVILYQGSFLSPAGSWNVDVARSRPYGVYNQVQLVAELVEAGYVVIQPEAEGGNFWSTNTGGNFEKSADGVFVPLLLRKVEQGAFGPVDLSRLYAAGFSSGGYMTSRMAVSFRGHFRALAIQSASYATCGGAFCWVPFALPADHPPTLLLHGADDKIVPISTATTYDARLRANRVESKFVRSETSGHEWLPVASAEIVEWFDTH